MVRRLAALVVMAGLLAPLPAFAQPKPQSGTDAILILDASGSMWGVVEDQTKIAAARQAVGTILLKWKPSDRLGLMVYGHRSKGDCKDIELMVPVGPLDAARIRNVIGSLNPKGKTPLSDSLRQAATALRATENRATVILVSDGIETCSADPCAVAAELKKAGVGFTAHVIGLDVADPVAKAQLQCIARNTGGVYIDARNASSLETALGKAIDATQGGKVASEAPARAAADPIAGKNWRAIARLAEGLDPITDSLAWQLYQPGNGDEKGEYVQTEYGARLAATAEPGKYVMTVDYGNTSRAFPITITKDKPVTHDVVLNAGYVTSEGAIGGSGAKAEDVTWEIHTSGGEYVSTLYDRVPKFILPAGSYVLKLSKGNASTEKPFSLAAGDQINLALTLEAGRLTVDALYAKGGPKIENGMAFSIRKPSTEEGKDGEWIATTYDPLSKFDLPAGNYDLVLEIGRTTRIQRVAVKAGDQTRITMVAEAGVLGLQAPGAESIEMLSPVKDINGNRKSVFLLYEQELNAAFPAGDYIVQIKAKGKTKEQPLSIKAGERTELTIRP